MKPIIKNFYILNQKEHNYEINKNFLKKEKASLKWQKTPSHNPKERPPIIVLTKNKDLNGRQTDSAIKAMCYCHEYIKNMDLQESLKHHQV
jgi:hypothetical protein